MARSDSGATPRSANSRPPSGSSTPRTSSTTQTQTQTRTPRDSPPSPPSSSSSGQRTPNRKGTRTQTRTRQHHSRSLDLELTKHLRPAFILSPLEPCHPVSQPVSSSFADQMSGFGSIEESERPRRAVSSPQLVRTGGRARSDSASSSASLTATEENYARAGARGGRAYGGHGPGVGAYSHSASSSRFPTTYPPLWTFAAQPVSVSPVSPTSPDSSEAASPSDDAEDDEDEDSEMENGQDEDDLIFVSRASSSTSVGTHMHLRNRRNGHGQRRKEPELGVPRVVTTARGQPCAGETETELDELPIRLPTSRNVNSRPVVPLLIDILVPFLFQVTRFLSIVPATFGTLYNMYLAFHPRMHPVSGVKISSIDYVVCALWAILTGFQCLFLTTGLLSRWKAYYTTPSTLIRLVALQCICWPATHLTLIFFDHRWRPVACWALIGTTTCLSRSVQLWVTSNLYMPSNKSEGVNLAQLTRSSSGKVLREGKLGPRRWDWAEVIVKCALPAGMLYFLTAWAMILKEELEVFGR